MKLFRILRKQGLVTIPYKIRQRMQLKPNDILSFVEGGDGRTIILRKEQICECDKASPHIVTRNEIHDFLDKLTAEEQLAATLYLKQLWMRQQHRGLRYE